MFVVWFSGGFGVFFLFWFHLIWFRLVWFGFFLPKTNRLMYVRDSRARFPTGVLPSEQSLVFNQESLLAMPCLCFLCELSVNSVYE